MSVGDILKRAGKYLVTVLRPVAEQAAAQAVEDLAKKAAKK